MTYKLIDSGNQLKLEKFGEYILMRPCAQALWRPAEPVSVWKSADAIFSRDGGNQWTIHKRLPSVWKAEVGGIVFKISPTDFGHLGVFPEHSVLWQWMQKKIGMRKKPNILNLFAYSGGATLAAAKAGAQVCHVDASKGMVSWARENAVLNGLGEAPIRWIVDDVMKFLTREKKRGNRYDGIILDPPSFGRGAQGELFKIERDILPLLEACREVLSDHPQFFIFSTHTPGMSSLVMEYLMQDVMKTGERESGEMAIPGNRSLPCGSYVRWYGNH